MEKFKVQYFVERSTLVQIYVLLLAGQIIKGAAFNESTEGGSTVRTTASTPGTQETSKVSSRPTLVTTASAKIFSSNPPIPLNKTWNCTEIKVKNAKVRHPNTSVYVSYSDDDSYVCNLNPLQCKRPKQPVEGNTNSLADYPKYGDYTYLPISQWILLLQHGAVAFLYHPCTSEENISKLRKIARKCMRRHIITPYEHLNISQPIAMVAWASFYADGYVNETAGETWIKNNAMKGPASHILFDGNYKLGLIRPARVVSDVKDSDLCPKEQLKKTTVEEGDLAILHEHYNIINKHGHSSKQMKKQLIQKLKKGIRPEKRHRDSGQAAWAVGSLLFLCLVLVVILVYTKPWNERDYYLKEKMASRNNNSNFSLLKSHLRPSGRSWREVAEQQRNAAASRRLLGPIHEEEEDFMDL